MTTALDTNVVVALWDTDHVLNRAALAALERAFRRGSLVMTAPVFAELMAAPGRTEAFVSAFLEDTGIGVEWTLEEAIWRAAGRAFQGYAERRRRHHDSGPRRLLVDFLIGAHAQVRGHRLLTLDQGLYRSAFAKLTIESL